MTSNDPLNACDPFGLYVFTGTTVFNGKGNASPIGGFLYGATIVIKDFHFAAHVEGKDDCSCCVDSVDVILGIYEFVPIVGDEFQDRYGTFTATAGFVGGVTAHEQLHVDADTYISGQLFPKLESDCRGKCWKALEGRWTQEKCANFVGTKIRGEMDWVMSKLGEAGHELHVMMYRHFPYSDRHNQQQRVDAVAANYAKYYQNATTEWKKHGFCDRLENWALP